MIAGWVAAAEVEDSKLNAVTHGGCRNQDFSQRFGRAVGSVTRAEIIRSINDDVAVSGKSREFFFVDVVGDDIDRNGRIDGA